MLSVPLNKGVKPFTKLTFPISRQWFTLLADHAYNLSSRLPTQTHQLP